MNHKRTDHGGIWGTAIGWKLLHHFAIWSIVVLITVPQVLAANARYNSLKNAQAGQSVRPPVAPPKPVAVAPKPVVAVAPIKHTLSTAASGQSYGIAAGSSLPALSDAELERSLQDMKALGIGWVRFDIEWENVQPDGPGVYNWGTYDRVVQAVNAHGLHALPILDYTPAWAREADCAQSPKCVPADANAYASFAAAATTRYSSYGVTAWEIWNEPNTANFFQPAANPSAYAALLKAAYATIKRVQPAATVLTGGLSPAGNDNGNLTPPDFMAGIYAAGAAGSFDAVADHPYTYPFTAAYPNPYNAWGQMSSIHGIMTAHGDGAKKVWVTEYGAPTGGPGPLASSGMSSAESGSDHVTEALESSSATQAVAIARSYPWTGPFFWYSYRDAGATQDTNENYFGLVRADWSHKPAYTAYQQAINGG